MIDLNAVGLELVKLHVSGEGVAGTAANLTLPSVLLKNTKVSKNTYKINHYL